MKICLLFLMVLLFLSNSSAGYCQICLSTLLQSGTTSGLPSEFKGVDTSVDYQYMEELSKNNNLWATELLKKWKKLTMVGVTY